MPEPYEVVFHQKDTVETERFGFTNIVDIIGVDLTVVRLLADFGSRTAEQSKSRYAFYLPLPDSKFLFFPKVLSQIPRGRANRSG